MLYYPLNNLLQKMRKSLTKFFGTIIYNVFAHIKQYRIEQ
jgi:hypothetical protein